MSEKLDPGNLPSLMSRKLRSSYSFIKNEINKLGLNDLDTSHGDILFQLYSSGPLTMKALASRIDRDKSTITTLIKKMEKLDLICRDTDPEDGRSCIVKLTTKGKSYKKDFFKISGKLLKKLYKNFSNEEKQLLVNLIAKLG